MPYSNKIQHAAYKTAQENVSKCRQVVMLYDGAIRFIQKAIVAIEENNIQNRYNNLEKACTIIIGLQSALDFEKGGEIAQLLYDYYYGMDMRLMEVHRTNSTKACEQVIRELKLMREAWEEIDANQTSVPTPNASAFESHSSLSIPAPHENGISSVSVNI